jgi:pantothenate kinase-related protein Tda10
MEVLCYCLTSFVNASHALGPYAVSFDRPLIIALSSSNGAGKSTFYVSYLTKGGLRFIATDE